MAMICAGVQWHPVNPVFARYDQRRKSVRYPAETGIGYLIDQIFKVGIGMGTVTALCCSTAIRWHQHMASTGMPRPVPAIYKSQSHQSSLPLSPYLAPERHRQSCLCSVDQSNSQQSYRPSRRPSTIWSSQCRQTKSFLTTLIEASMRQQDHGNRPGSDPGNGYQPGFRGGSSTTIRIADYLNPEDVNADPTSQNASKQGSTAPATHVCGAVDVPPSNISQPQGILRTSTSAMPMSAAPPFNTGELMTPLTIPSKFTCISVHTAKCQVCWFKNAERLYRCNRCSWTICTPCLRRVNYDFSHKGCQAMFDENSTIGPRAIFHRPTYEREQPASMRAPRRRRVLLAFNNGAGVTDATTAAPMAGLKRKRK
jgi:hypothetical protein